MSLLERYVGGAHEAVWNESFAASADDIRAQLPSLSGIVEIAQPELKLPGLRINSRSCSASRFSSGEDR